MTPITRAQRVALKRVYDRSPLYSHCRYGTVGAIDDDREYGLVPLTYREFRMRVRYASYDPCIMVQWCGMWLGIEPDGYTHS